MRDREEKKINAPFDEIEGSLEKIRFAERFDKNDSNFARKVTAQKQQWKTERI